MNGSTQPTLEDSNRGSLYPDLSQELEYIETHVDASEPINNIKAGAYSQGISEQRKSQSQALSNGDTHAANDSILSQKTPASPSTNPMRNEAEDTAKIDTLSADDRSKVIVLSHGQSSQNVSVLIPADASQAAAIPDESTRGSRLTDRGSSQTRPNARSSEKRSRNVGRPSSSRHTIESDTSSDSDTGFIASNNTASREWPPQGRGTKNRNTKQSSAVGAQMKTQAQNANETPRDQRKLPPIPTEDSEVVKPKESGTSPMQLANPRVNVSVSERPHATPNTPAGPSKLALKPKAPTSLLISQSTRKTPATGDTVPSVPSASATDPFITTEHVQRLKSLEKRKRKEKPHDRVASDRRLTFGGFPTKEVAPPRIDLRKKIHDRNRYSLDWRALSTKAASPTIREAEETHKLHDSGESSRSRRTSFVTTIDLAEEVPSPAHGIPPSDQVLINRAGLQFFVQAMAQNHGVSEDWVRRVYEERQSLPDTDRILGEMRVAAERAFEEAMLRDVKGTRLSAATGDNTHSSRPHTRATLAEELLQEMNSGDVVANRSVHDNIFSIADEEPEQSLRFNEPRTSQAVVSATQQRNELHFTPTDPQAELKRALNRYAPPSTSRAARYVRRARRSTGMSKSPTKHSPRTIEGGDARYEISDDDKEADEVENSPALFRPLADESTRSTSSVADKENDEFGSLKPNEGTLNPPVNESEHAQIASELIWSAEEDATLERGEDGEAMHAILERRGKGAVRRRLVELMSKEDDLFG